MENNNQMLTKHYKLLVVSLPSTIVVKIDILKKRVENRDTAGNSSFNGGGRGYQCRGSG